MNPEPDMPLDEPLAAILKKLEDRAKFVSRPDAPEVPDRFAVDELRSRWNAPKRQASKRFDQLDMTREWGAKFRELLAKLAGPGVMIGLTGERGNGKTQLAVCLMKEATRKGRSALYMTAMDFFLEVKSTFGDSPMSEKSTVEKFCRPSLLVIDEFSKRGESEWHQNLLFAVIDKRYSSCRDTVIIDNRNPAEFTTALGPSLASRMTEGGGIVHATWDNYREPDGHNHRGCPSD